MTATAAAETRPPQFFDFGVYEYDIDAAERILAETPREPMPAPASALGGFLRLGIVNVDPVHVRTVDVTKPLIAAVLTEMDGTALIIDGWHRVARAIDDQVAQLQVLVLTAEETEQVRRRVH